MFEVENNRFFLEEEGKLLAEITWTYPNESTMNVDHTFVDPSQRGKGLAEKLVLAVIDKAKQENLKIYPTCSYVVSYFDKHSELADLRA